MLRSLVQSNISLILIISVFLAEHYESSFTSIFADQELPVEPSFYINVPSRIDSTAAPDGKDAIVVLVPVGHLGGPLGLKQGRMSEVVDIARRKVLAIIEKRIGLPSGEFKRKIAHEIVNTPETCELYPQSHVCLADRTVLKGAISSTLTKVLF